MLPPHLSKLTQTQSQKKDPKQNTQYYQHIEKNVAPCHPTHFPLCEFYLVKHIDPSQNLTNHAPKHKKQHTGFKYTCSRKDCNTEKESENQT